MLYVVMEQTKNGYSSNAVCAFKTHKAACDYAYKLYLESNCKTYGISDEMVKDSIYNGLNVSYENCDYKVEKINFVDK